MAGILITGATGFVGSHLVEAVARRGLRATALVRATSDTTLLERYGIGRVIGDLSEPESLQRAMAGASTVLHLGAATRALRSETFFRVNAEGTRRLVEAMEADGTPRRLVYLSSLSAAGARSDRPVRPDDEPQPLTAYGRSKLDGERAALASPTVTAAVLRPPAVYGPRDRDLLTFFKLAQIGILPVVGPPGRRLQLVHVRDLAGAILDAADAEASGIFHVAEPRAYTWRELLTLVSRAVGRKGVRVRIPAPVLRSAAAVTELLSRVVGRPAIFDRDKARELLAPGWLCETQAAREGFGFRASVSLDRGLEETAIWYRTYDWL